MEGSPRPQLEMMKQSPLAFPFPLPLQLLALFPSVFASYILTPSRPTEVNIFPGSSSRWLYFSSALLPWLGWPAKLWPVALWSGYVIFWWARPESHVWGKESAPPKVKNHPAGLDKCSRKPKRIHSIPFFLHSTIYWMSSHVPVNGWYVQIQDIQGNMAVHFRYPLTGLTSVIQAKTWRVSRCWLGEGQGRKEWGGRRWYSKRRKSRDKDLAMRGNKVL